MHQFRINKYVLASYFRSCEKQNPHIFAVFLLYHLPAGAGLGLGPVLVAGGGLCSPVLRLSALGGTLSGPILLDNWLVLSASGHVAAVPLLLVLIFGLVVHGDLLGGIVGCLALFLLLLSDFFKVSVEEEIGHDGPLFVSRELASEALNFTREQPVHETDAVRRTVVAWNDDINVLEGGVGVAEANGWDVDVAGLTDGLVVYDWVGDDDETGLSKAGLRVICEGTWRKSAVDAVGANKLGKLDDGALTEVFGRNDAYVLGVVDGGDDSRGKRELFPHFLKVEDVSTASWVSLEDILFHLVIAVSVA